MWLSPRGRSKDITISNADEDSSFPDIRLLHKKQNTSGTQYNHTTNVKKDLPVMSLASLTLQPNRSEPTIPLIKTVKKNSAKKSVGLGTLIKKNSKSERQLMQTEPTPRVNSRTIREADSTDEDCSFRDDTEEPYAETKAVNVPDKKLQKNFSLEELMQPGEGYKGLRVMNINSSAEDLHQEKPLGKHSPVFGRDIIHEETI